MVTGRFQEIDSDIEFLFTKSILGVGFSEEDSKIDLAKENLNYVKFAPVISPTCKENSRPQMSSKE